MAWNLNVKLHSTMDSIRMHASVVKIAVWQARVQWALHGFAVMHVATCKEMQDV